MLRPALSLLYPSASKQNEVKHFSHMGPQYTKTEQNKKSEKKTIKQNK